MADGGATPNPMADQSENGDDSMMIVDPTAGPEEGVDFFDHEPSKMEKVEVSSKIFKNSFVDIPYKLYEEKFFQDA